MALSTLQAQWAIQMLGIPANALYKVDQLGLNATQIFPTGTLKAIPAIQAMVAAQTADQQTITLVFINAYIASATAYGIRINNGSISEYVNGVTIDFQAARQGYIDQLKLQLPFWNTYETRDVFVAQQATMKQAAVLM